MNWVKIGIHEHRKNTTWSTPKFSRSLQGQRRSWTGYKWTFMNTQKIQLGQHSLFQVPKIKEAFMNGVWMGIHERPKNSTWPTPNFQSPCKVRGVHELVMNGHSWTPKKITLPTPTFPGTYKVRGVHELGINEHSWTPKIYHLANNHFLRYL